MRMVVLLSLLILLTGVLPVSAELRSLPDKRGRALDIDSLLVPEKQNIFCFFSNGNSICRGIYSQLVKLGQDPKLVVHVLEVPNAEAATAKKYNVTSVPYFIIYDARGQRESEGPTAYRTVTDLMRKAR